MPNSDEEFLGELRLGHQLVTPSQIAASGAIAIAGLILLLSNRAWILLGIYAPLAAIYISVVLGLTLATVVELLAGSSERGGTYHLVHELLGGWVSFLIGWSIIAGSISLMVAFLLEATRQITSFFNQSNQDPMIIAAALLALLLAIHLFQFFPRRFRLLSLTIPIIVWLLILLFTGLLQVQKTLFQTSLQLNLHALNVSTALLAGSYLAFEALLSSRRQVREPLRQIPRGIAFLLTLLFILFTVALFIVAGVPTLSRGDVNVLIIDLGTAGIFPSWVVAIPVIIILFLAASEAFIIAARQLNRFALEGALPRSLQQSPSFLRLPLPILVIVTVLAIPLIVWVRELWLINIAASCFLVVMIGVNAAAIYSHRQEPERRRTFIVPFAPLAPAIVIVLCLVLLNSLPFYALWSTGIWLALGALFYLLYARNREVEALEGEVVFGRAPHPDRKRLYRILVPIGPGEERHLVMRLAARISHEMHGEVIPMQVVLVPDPLAIEEGRRTAKERNTLFRWSTRMADNAGVPVHPITRLARSVQEGIIDTAIEESCDLILLSWSDAHHEAEGRMSHVLSSVVQNAPCDVAAVAYDPNRIRKLSNNGNGSQKTDQEGDLGFVPRRILVPTSGGPNAPLAIRLALQLAREFDSTVTTIYAASLNADQEEVADGERMIDQTIRTMREQASHLPDYVGDVKAFDQIPIAGQVVRAANVVEAISEVAEEYDLLLIGASEESLIDQFLFGNIPEQVAQKSQAPVIIVKRYQGLPRQWVKRAWNSLYQTFPTLSKQEQIEVYRATHRSARLGVDFFVMIGLSALIATFGLLMNSSAVIIGAMLVAPLFSPLLAIGLAIVYGNVRLLRLSIESTIKGIALAILFAVILAYLTPFKTPTPEVLARTQPNLYDLMVAVASGAAGAYAIARKSVAAALPGVAIAAALVPPLGVVGIGLSLGDLQITGGALLLLVTNLVAIVLSAVIIFLLLGFRPPSEGGRGTHIRHGLTTTLLLFILISIPLGAIFFNSVRNSTVKQNIQEAVVEQIASIQGLELVSRDDIQYQQVANGMEITIPVYTAGQVNPTVAEALGQSLTKAINQPVSVRLVLYPVIESTPFPTQAPVGSP